MESVASASKEEEEEEEEAFSCPSTPSLYSRPLVLAADVQTLHLVGDFVGWSLQGTTRGKRSSEWMRGVKVSASEGRTRRTAGEMETNQRVN